MQTLNQRVNRVLIIEDDAEVAELQRTVLTRAGFDVRSAQTGATGLTSANEYRPDVILLDVGLPDMSGLDVCARLADTVDAYVLMVSGHSREEDILRGLGLGADDYVTKPFSPSELVARVQALLRRRDRERSRDHGGKLTIGDATLVLDHQTLVGVTATVSLTALEFKLLWYLGEAEGKLLTRAQILERVWNDVSGVPTRVVDVHIAALRKKLSEVGSATQISSVRGIGYRLDGAPAH